MFIRVVHIARLGCLTLSFFSSRHPKFTQIRCRLGYSKSFQLLEIGMTVLQYYTQTAHCAFQKIGSVKKERKHLHSPLRVSKNGFGEKENETFGMTVPFLDVWLKNTTNIGRIERRLAVMGCYRCWLKVSFHTGPPLLPHFKMTFAGFKGGRGYLGRKLTLSQIFIQRTLKAVALRASTLIPPYIFFWVCYDLYCSW